MSFAHLKEIFGTLRFRLTVWNTAIVLLMVVVTLWGVREGLRLTLWHEADDQLSDDAQEILLTIEQLYPDVNEIHAELDRKAISHTHQGLYIQIFNSEHKADWTSNYNTPPSIPPFEPEQTNEGPYSVGQYRLVQLELDKPRVPRWTIRVAASFAPLDEDVARLTRLMLAAGTLVMIVSPLGGYWLAGRATRPLAQIIETTGRLHAGNLDERLVLRGTRDELDQLSATINGFLDRIAAFVSQNREFTANAAHELRSPLTAIQSSIEVALNSDRTVDEYNELICDILEECSNLRVLVNQMLILAESDAGRLLITAEVVDLEQIVQRACEMFQGVAESRNIELCLLSSGPVQVLGDATRLRQVINNLIDNAIKFSEEGGQIAVQVRHSSADGLALFSVRDHGSGIAAEDLPHIFERFYLGDKARLRDKKGRGSGLGLPICQSIVAAHGGQIHVSSTLGVGTIVTVSLASTPGPGTHEIPAATAHAHQDQRATTPIVAG